MANRIIRLAIGLCTCAFLALASLPGAAADLSSGTADGAEEWGYIDVRPGAHVFWWLYYNDGLPADEVPIVMWFQGGPDNPVGTGFSYVDEPALLTTTNQQVTNDSVSFLVAFFKTHDSLRKAPFYIVAESYGGKFASELGVAIHELLGLGILDFNFKGVVLGDTWISPIDFLYAWGPLLKAFSLIDERGTELLQRFADAAQAEIDKGQFVNATFIWGDMEEVVEELTDNVDFYNLLNHETDYAEAAGLLGLNSRHVLRYQPPSLEQTMNGPVRQKLGIIPTEIRWSQSSGQVFQALGADFMKDTIGQVDKLLQYGVDVTIYSGQLDLICCTTGTEAWVQKLKWPYLPAFNKAKRAAITCEKGEAAAFFKEYRNLRFYWILNAGHMVPSDNPCMALKMLRLITGQSVTNSRWSAV